MVKITGEAKRVPKEKTPKKKVAGKPKRVKGEKKKKSVFKGGALRDAPASVKGPHITVREGDARKY
jgi:hypothetical protein